jgi:hemolysin activation/secretion protein
MRLPISQFERQTFVLLGLFIGLLSMGSQAAIAQPTSLPAAPPGSDPNRDRFPQALPNLQPIPSNASPPIPAPVAPLEALPTQPNTPISVRKVLLTGNTVLSQTDIQAITQQYEGKTVTLGELQKLAEAITQLYINRGYITSRAVLVPQSITDGVVKVQAEEGSIEAIEIEGTRRVRPAYIRSRLELGITNPLKVDQLEDQLRLLRVDPLFAEVEASLRLGTQEGKSILQVRVKESSPLTAGASFDNYSPPSVGGERVSVFLGYRNLTGNADDLTGSYQRSTTGGLSALDFSYRIPVNPMNGTVQFRTAANWTKITADDFELLNLKGRTNLYELSYRQPLIRTARQELALSLGFSYQDGQTFVFNDTPFGFGIGPDADGRSKTRVLRFGQDYVKRDRNGAWALRSQFNIGLGIFNATENDAPIPDGRFFSWLGQVQRIQQLNAANLLILQGDLQLTPDSLLPSQQFVIGGGQSLRGFRQNARSGDNGFRISAENRIAVIRSASGLPILQVAPFVDFGKVWNRSDNPNLLPRQTFLAGGGIGLIWQPIARLTLRLDGAVPFLNLSDRGGNVQEKAFYFSLNYQL